MAHERSIEFKVGILILVSLLILCGFALIMGGVSFQKTYALYVDFDNPGGLQSGAPIRMAGLKVGSVESFSFQGGRIDPTTGRRTLVRVKAKIESRYQDTIREDADFYVTTQGVLGEQFLAIEPGTPSRPALQDGAIVKGIDPPRLDLFLAKAFELLDTTVTAIRNNRALIAELATNLATLLKDVSSVLGDNRERIGRIVENVEKLSSQSVAVVEGARKTYIDNPKVKEAIDNIDTVAVAIARDTEPMLRDARESLAQTNRITATLAEPKQQERMRKILEDMALLASRANAVAADAQVISGQVRRGKGTVGGLVMDEEIYDNIQEMVRDLKHNPWKFLWRE